MGNPFSTCGQEVGCLSFYSSGLPTEENFGHKVYKQILPKARQLSAEFRRVTVKRSNLQGS